MRTGLIQYLTCLIWQWVVFAVLMLLLLTAGAAGPGMTASGAVVVLLETVVGGTILAVAAHLLIRSSHWYASRLTRYVVCLLALMSSFGVFNGIWWGMSGFDAILSAVLQLGWFGLPSAGSVWLAEHILDRRK